MKTWIVTILIVAGLVCLVASASWWVPTVLALVVPWLPDFVMAVLMDDPALVEGITLAVRAGLWVLAALIGALGARWALEQSEPAAQTAGAARQKAAARVRANGNGAGRKQAKQPGDAPTEGSLVSFLTDGGVRIIADSDCIGIENGEVVLSRRAGDGDGDTVPKNVPAALRVAVPTALNAAETAPQDGAKRPVVSGAEPPRDTRTPIPDPLITLPFNLPSDLPDFVGRSQEVAQVRRRLAERNAARPGGLVATSIITGMGGIGKTTLALRAAHELAAEGVFPDVQLYIDLKGTERHPLRPGAALNTLLTALLGPDAARPEGEGQLADLWRAALMGKQALLVLDNAANAAQVRPLLPGSPTCGVVITSRQRFTVPGGRLLELRGLAPEEAQTLLQTLAPHLEDPEAAQIAELCGGLPLALRIAGNYLTLNDDLSPADYASHLANERESLSYLRDPENSGLDVAATLSLSVGQLEAGTRWAWTMLGLLPAPFDASAASALWGEGVARDAWEPLDRRSTTARLRALRNRSLVIYDPESNRYRLHDLLHLAASRELERAEEVDGARRRLAYHFLNLAQTFDKQQRYLELDPHWPHLQAVLRYARQEGDVDLLSDLVLALNDYWSARGMVRERTEWSQRAARACAAAGRRQAEGIHLGNLGNAHAERGNARRAIEFYGQALTISRGIRDQRGEAALLGNLGQAYAAFGEAERAVQYHEQALKMAQGLEDARAAAGHLGDLGRAYADLGEPQQAISYYEQALSSAHRLGDHRMEGTILGSLGLAYADQGDLQQAIDCQKEALAIYRQIGDLRGEASAMDSLGRAYADLDEPQRAIDYFEQALEIDQRIGDRRGEGVDLGNLGMAHAELGEHQSAIDYYEQAMKIARQVGDRRTEGACLGNVGRVYVELGDIHQAMANYKEALQIAQQIGDRRNEGTWLGNLGQAHARLGAVDEAVDYHRQALEIYREIGDRRSEGNHLASLGMLARMQGDRERARQAWTESYRTFAAMKDPNAGRVWHWISELDAQPA